MPSDGNTGMFSVALSWTSECFNNICKVVDHCLDNTTNIRKNYIKHFTLSFDPESFIHYIVVLTLRLMGLRGRRYSITSSRGATARGGSGTGLRVIVEPLSMVVIPPPTKKKKSARRLDVLRKGRGTYSPSLNGINQPTHHPRRPGLSAYDSFYPRVSVMDWVPIDLG